MKIVVSVNVSPNYIFFSSIVVSLAFLIGLPLVFRGA